MILFLLRFPSPELGPNCLAHAMVRDPPRNPEIATVQARHTVDEPSRRRRRKTPPNDSAESQTSTDTNPLVRT